MNVDMMNCWGPDIYVYPVDLVPASTDIVCMQPESRWLSGIFVIFTSSSLAGNGINLVCNGEGLMS
jgi:hypothetical protein